MWYFLDKQLTDGFFFAFKVTTALSQNVELFHIVLK